MIYFKVVVMKYNFTIFFFQAEDGIRDRTVTGVQTCALPILAGCDLGNVRAGDPRARALPRNRSQERRPRRSEERRVGKECRARGSADREEKKNEISGVKDVVVRRSD